MTKAATGPRLIYPPDDFVQSQLEKITALEIEKRDLEECLTAERETLQCRVVEIQAACAQQGHKSQLEKGEDGSYGPWTTQEEESTYHYGENIILWRRCQECQFVQTAWVNYKGYHLFFSERCAMCFSAMKELPRSSEYVLRLEKVLTQDGVCGSGSGMRLGAVYECKKCGHIYIGLSYDPC